MCITGAHIRHNGVRVPTQHTSVTPANDYVSPYICITISGGYRLPKVLTELSKQQVGINPGNNQQTPATV